MLRFKVDENLPQALVGMLQGAGHDACSVLDQRMGGASDDSVARVCREECRCLITLDLDFVDTRLYPPSKHAGIIVLRVRRQDKPHIVDVFSQVIPMLSTHMLQARLWIVDETSLRVRE